MCPKKVLFFYLVWFGLVCRRLPELKVPNLHFRLLCSISYTEVPTPFESSARATELESYSCQPRNVVMSRVSPSVLIILGAFEGVRLESVPNMIITIQRSPGKATNSCGRLFG